MKEKELLTISLIVSLIGVLVLFFVSEFADIEKARIADFSPDDIDNHVKVIGTVTKVQKSGETTVMEVMQPEKINVVLFDSIDLEEGNYIEVLGELSEGADGFDIIGDRIRFID